MGGAFFPTARKWSLVAAQQGPRAVVINADEGEVGFAFAPFEEIGGGKEDSDGGDAGVVFGFDDGKRGEVRACRYGDATLGTCDNGDLARVWNNEQTEEIRRRFAEDPELGMLAANIAAVVND